MARQQIADADFGGARQDNRAFDRVFELAHIARPRIHRHPLARTIAKARQTLAVLLRETLQERLGEDQDVGTPLAQRRQNEFHHRQPVVQVLTQLVIGNRLLNILVGRRDDTNVDRNFLLATESADGPRLECTEQLHLDVDRHFSQFVEEKCSAARVLERARFLIHGARERAFFVAEQFILKNFFRQRSAVERVERAFRAIALLMQRARNQLFTRAAIAEDQHTGVGRRDGFNQAVHLTHRFRLTDQFAETREPFKPR